MCRRLLFGWGGSAVQLNLPRGAFVTIQPFVGLVISNESLVLRIPLEPAVIPIGQISQVADRHGSAADLDVANGFVPAAHTFQKVPDVVGGGVCLLAGRHRNGLASAGRKEEGSARKFRIDS